jgi:hypothetical protein
MQTNTGIYGGLQKMNWKPGDRAIVVGMPMTGAEYVGSEVTVTSIPYGIGGAVLVSISGAGTFKRAEVQFLKPIDDDYDGHQTTTWDECPWKPKELVRA